MNFDFSDDQKQIKDQARKFLSEKCTTKTVRKLYQGSDGYDAALWKQIAEMGWMGTAIPEAFGGLPAGLEADVWKGGEELPSSADEVEFVVFPFGMDPEILRKIVTLPKLKTIQILSAGADHILPYIPDNITLCNARGAHTPATAEWTAGVIIASIRNFPRFAAGQQAGHWDPAVSDLIAGKRVLIVGYGSIGEAVERRL